MTQDITPDPTVNDFLSRAAVRGTEQQARLAQKLSDLAKYRNKSMKDLELTDVYEMLADTIHEFEFELRKQLSAILSRNAECPKALIRFLSNDKIEIALPVILSSPLLEESDLLEIVEHRSMEHRLAMAQRSKLPMSVSDAIAMKGEEQPILALLYNNDTKIRSQTVDYLIEESRRHTNFQRPLINRAELDTDLALKLAAYASAAIRETVIEKFNFDPEIVEDAVREAEIEFNRQFKEIMSEWGKADDLTKSLIKRQKISVQNLPYLLQSGEMALFISVFHHFTRLPKLLARRILFERGSEALAVVCKAIGLTEDHYILLHQQIARSRFGNDPKMVKMEKDESLKIFRQYPLDKAKRILEYWQNDREFLIARRSVRQYMEAKEKQN